MFFFIPKEYEVLDYFWYALAQEDFENKWEAIGWPFRLQKQVEATNLFLDEEVQKFLKIHIDDEFTLQEKIETLTVQVTHMSALRDASKVTKLTHQKLNYYDINLQVHEIAVDMRRVWKSLKEAQEQGQLLNQRQKLFELPVVPFDAINRLIKEFEPYKNLWITASDWLRAYDIWMDNPLVNVDGEAIERTVNEMYKTMVKSVRIFADIVAVQNVAIEVKGQIDEFKPLIPLIQAVRSPGMRDRHWENIKETTGDLLHHALYYSPCLFMKYHISFTCVVRMIHHL